MLAIAVELGWFHLISPAALFLIHFTLFPGFIGLIAVAFALPGTTPLRRPSEAV